MHMRRWVLRLTIAYQKARHTGTFETPLVNGSATIQKRDTGQALCSCLWRCARLGPATANWTGDISLEGWSLQNLRSALLRCKAVSQERAGMHKRITGKVRGGIDGASQQFSPWTFTRIARLSFASIERSSRRQSAS